MKPILFYVGSFPVRAYSLFLLLGMGAGFLVLRRGWKESGLRPGSIYLFCAGAILCALVGGRLGYVLLHGAQIAAEPGRWLRFWQVGGEVAWGAMGALLAWSWVYSRRAAVSTAVFFDLLAPPAALAEGIMRWGCLLNGCCYGRETTGFPGMVLPDLNGRWALRYPTQVLYSAVGLGLFALLWAGRRKKPFAGFLALMFLILYSASRLAIGALRGDYATTGSRFAFLGLDLALLIVGAGLMAWQVRRARKDGEGAR
jgi:phosphatidylglycerol:prolipoprotein diacylglycerol transferase